MNSDNSYDRTQPNASPQDDSPGSRFRAYIIWPALDLIIGIIAVVFVMTAIAVTVATIIEPYGDESSEAYFGSAVGTMCWQAAFLLITFMVVARRGGGWANLGLRATWIERNGILRAVVDRSPLPAIPTIAIAGYLACYILVFVYNIIVQVTGAEFLQPDAQLPENLFDSDAVVVATGLAVVIGAPIAEEVLFRGFLFGGLRRYLPFWSSMLISGFIFSLVHGDIGFIIPFTLVGMVLAFVYERSGTLLAAIGVHFLFNLTSFSFLLLFPELRSP